MAQQRNGTPNRSQVSHWDLPAQFIPASLTVVTNSDSWITELTLSCVANCTVTVQDNQNTPFTLVPAVPLVANSLTIMTFQGAKCALGFSWSASVANAVVARVRMI